MADIKKMYCPSCGAPVSFEPGREDTFCSSCGSQLYFQDDHLEVKLKHEERKMEHEEKILEYQDREATRKHEIEEQKAEMSNLIKSTILMVAVSALVIGFIIFLVNL